MTIAPTPNLDAAQAEALRLLREGRRFLLVGHVRPDGDCIGAQAALAVVLGELGKEVVILNPDGPGPEFDYLESACPFRHFEGELPAHDVCILLDINELSRCGAMETPLREYPSKKVVIDHHPLHGESWWDAAFMDSTASATGVLVWRIKELLGCQGNETLAKAVFTSLVTDTGWFKYSNTDAEAMAVAAEVVGAGVVPADVYAALYQRHKSGQPAAVAALLGRARFYDNGRLAVVDQPLDFTLQHGLEDSDPVLDSLRSVESVEVVLYLREVEADVCKLSARSKTTFNVNALARRFGGGGHVKASGALIQGPLEATKAGLIEAALEDLAGLPQ